MASDVESATDTEHIYLDAYQVRNYGSSLILLYKHDISIASWSETNFLGTEKRER